jgi:hypothetical protein
MCTNKVILYMVSFMFVMIILFLIKMTFIILT